jgi:hypothetical protein
MRRYFPVNFKIMYFNISGIHIWPLLVINQQLLLEDSIQLAPPQGWHGQATQVFQNSPLCYAIWIMVQSIFDFFHTDDFELILRIVWQANNVNKALEIEDDKTESSYIHVRDSHFFSHL